MSTTATLFRDSITLRHGASRCLQMAAGTYVTAQEGALLLTEPPQWLGEQIHQPVMRIGANAGHLLQQGGWVRLDALQDCRIRISLPQPAPGLRQRLRAAATAGRRAWRQPAAADWA